MKWTAPPSKRGGAADWLDLIFKDHGFLRFYWHNQHLVADGLWRSNQPGPKRVEALANLGIKTIVNLRGPRDDGGWQLEAEACTKTGMTLLDFTSRSRAAPSKEMLYEARELFANLEKPALVHCKSGADRAGIVSALYLLIVEERPTREAMGQLSWTYGHVKAAKTGVLDAFFESYIPYEDKGMTFFDWVKTVYDPEELAASFTAKGWAEQLTNTILRRE